MRGFTMIEILAVLGVIILLSTMAIMSFGGSRNGKILEITARDIVFALEEAKTNAVAGKDASSFGVRFDTSSYTTFKGNTYDANSASNVTKLIDSNILTITNTANATNGTIIFERISGKVSSPATTTIALTSSPATKIEIYVGPLGDINMIQ